MLPGAEPKKFPYRVTYAPENPFTGSPPVLGPLVKSEKKITGAAAALAAWGNINGNAKLKTQTAKRKSFGASP